VEYYACRLSFLESHLRFKGGATAGYWPKLDF